MKNYLLRISAACLLWSASGLRADEAPPATKPAEKPGESPSAEGPKKPVSDFIRYQIGEEKSHLQTACKTYALKSGTEVTLVGVVHIADKAYYQKLNEHLATYDSVLYELVGDPEDLKKKDEATNPLRAVQKMAGTLLKLDFQLDNIDYTKANFVHADLNQEEFQKQQGAKGENMMDLLARAMKMEREGKIPGAKEMSDLDLPTLLSALNGADGADGLKNMMARMFDKSEAMIVEFEGEEGTVLLTERNKAVMRVLKTQMEAGKKKLAIFYGAGHLPGLEDLLKEQEFTLASEEWLDAWTMKKMAERKKAE